MENELIQKENSIIVSASPHPFKASNVLMGISEGYNLSELLEQVQFDEVLRDQAHIFLNDELIHERLWESTYPEADDFVYISVVPAKSRGKSPLRTIATIAIIAASSTLAPGIGASLSQSLFTKGIISISKGFATGLVKAAISGVGMLALNAIAPPARASSPNLPQLSGSAESGSPTLFIEGARNTARHFGTVPVILGTHKSVPPLGAKTRTEIIGEDEYLKMIVVWGYGRLKIEDIKIGTDLLSSFDDVTIETREGVSGDAALTVYPDQVDENRFSIELFETDGFHTRTTELEVDSISVDIVFFGGFVAFDSKGNKGSIVTNYNVQFREVGDVTWLAPTFTEKNFPDEWIGGSGGLGEFRLFGSKAQAVRFGMKWDVASRGQYEVRVRRFTVDRTGQSDVFDLGTWSVLRSHKNEDPISFSDPLAVSALSIKATSQLSGIIDNLNATVTSYAQDFDNTSGDGWHEAITSNPASLFRHVLQSPANVKAVADARLDLDTLETFHTYCATNGFEFNMIRDFKSSVWDTLSDICSVARATPVDVDGKWSVVIDQLQTVPRQHYTNKNSWGFKAEKLFLDVPHGFKMPFPNRDKEWQQDELIVYDDGFSAANATEFEQLDGIGITDKDHLWKFGRFHLAGIRLRPERYTFNTDFEYLIAKKGDLILISHDVLLVGLAVGRIKSVITQSNGDVTGLTVDEIFTMEAAKTYGVSIRTVGDIEIVREITTDVGDQTSITLSTVITAANAPIVGDLISFGLSGSETLESLIIGIETHTELTALISAIPNSPAIYTADTGTIPAFDSKLSALAGLPDVQIESTTTDESVLVRGTGDTLLSRIKIDVTPIADSFNASLRAEIRVTSVGENFAAATVSSVTKNQIILTDVEDGETYDVRVQWTSPDFVANSAFSTANGVLVIGQAAAPAPLVNLNLSAFGGQAYLRWDQPVELDVRFGGSIEFRHSHETSSAIASWTASVGIGTKSKGTDVMATLPLKTGTYLARVFDKGGRPSTVVAIDTKQAALLDFGAASNITEEPTFAGTHTNTVAIDNIIKLVGTTAFDSWADVDLITNWDSEGGVVTSGTYDFASGHDQTTVKKARATTDINVIITNLLDQMDSWTGNVNDREDWDGVTTGEGDARVQVRVTDDDPALSASSFSAWNNIDSAEHLTRGLDYRLQLTSTNPAFTPVVSKLQVNLEEPS
ncbi:MAG: hypothetical protein HOG49_19400 [Candidatus Scalindua sp.]|jgi:hypothetical protein|nr:hypothetical protein [Candidatus Scalindua sp.]